MESLSQEKRNQSKKVYDTRFLQTARSLVQNAITAIQKHKAVCKEEDLELVQGLEQAITIHAFACSYLVEGGIGINELLKEITCPECGHRGAVLVSPANAELTSLEQVLTESEGVTLLLITCNKCEHVFTLSLPNYIARAFEGAWHGKEK